MKENLHIRKEHNVSLILYHFVCPAKYRRDIFVWEVVTTLVRICKEIEEAYEIRFEEIGADINHVHFMIQWVPTQSPTSIIRKVKSITAINLFKEHPEIKKKLWWWQLRTKGYYVNTVWMYWSYDNIKSYIQHQWEDKEYKERYKNTKWMTSLFEWMVF
jgi:REP element-mobilizing transposase RayT